MLDIVANYFPNLSPLLPFDRRSPLLAQISSSYQPVAAAAAATAATAAATAAAAAAAVN